MKDIFFTTLLLLMILLGLGAVGGGGVMILDPGGEWIGMPMSMLEHSPFTSFLWPGIILFTIFGLFPLLLSWMLVKKPVSPFMEGLNLISDMHWTWTFTIYIAFGLIIWIQIQMEMLKDIHWLHDLYTFYGLFMIAMALMPGVRARYSKFSYMK